MTATHHRTQLVENLLRTMDELCAPDLTLARAEILRPRVARILDALRASEPRPPSRGTLPGEWLMNEG